MNRSLCALVALSLSIFAAAPIAAASLVAILDADGALHPATPTNNFGVITLSEGVEDLTLGMSVDVEAGESVIWVLSLPAAPQGVSTEVVHSFPEPIGRSQRRLAYFKVFSTMGLVRLSQIWPFVADAMVLPNVVAFIEDPLVDVEVDRAGVSVEQINAEGLVNLGSWPEQDSAIFPGRAAVVADGAGDHALVLVRVQAGEAGVRRPCVSLRFPAEQPFFPGRAQHASDAKRSFRTYLSVRGNAALRNPEALTSKVPAVSGWNPWSASGFGTPSEGVYVGHFVEDVRNGDQQPSAPFTSVLIFTRPGQTVGDLSFDQLPPVSGPWPVALLGSLPPLLTWAAIVLVLSYLSAGLTGVLMHRRWHPIAIWGLWNLLTLLGLRLAIKDGKSNTAELLRSKRFCLPFTIIFVILSYLLQVVLMAPMG